MGAREKSLRQMRVLYLAFVITWFLFIFILQVQLKPAVRPIEPITVGALALAAVSSVSIGWTMRGKQLAIATEVLQREPEDRSALARWRAGGLRIFCRVHLLSR